MMKAVESVTPSSARMPCATDCVCRNSTRRATKESTRLRTRPIGLDDGGRAVPAGATSRLDCVSGVTPSARIGGRGADENRSGATPPKAPSTRIASGRTSAIARETAAC